MIEGIQLIIFLYGLGVLFNWFAILPDFKPKQLGEIFFGIVFVFGSWLSLFLIWTDFKLWSKYNFSWMNRLKEFLLGE